jgi:DNA-binding MarR family transcriptional regulator
VVREPNPQDGCSAYATLTAEGLKRFRRAAPAYVAAIEQHFSSELDDAELRTLTQLLQRVLTD